MTGVQTGTLVCALLVVLANQVTGNRGSSQMVENPRVERSGSEMAGGGCEGSWCKSRRDSSVGTLWFGPRLGRRRRSDIKFPTKKFEAIEEVMDLPISDLIVVPAYNMQRPGGNSGSDNKRQETTFTPRLGRDLDVSTLSAYDLTRLLLLFAELQDQQSPPPTFPPRLGRDLPVDERTRLRDREQLRRLLEHVDDL